MYTRLVWWSLRGRRSRRLVDVLIMAITVAVVIVFVSIMAELVRVARAARAQELTRGLVFPKVVRGGMPMALHSTLTGTDGVVHANRYRAFPGRYDNGGTYLIMGEEDNAPELMLDVFPTEPQVIEAWKQDRLAAMVTEAVAKELDLAIGSESEVPTIYGPLRIKVVGITKGAAVAHAIRVRFDYIKDLQNKTGTCNFRIYTKPGDFERVAKAIQDKTENSSNPVIVVTARSWFATFIEGALAVPAVLGFLGLFLMVTTALTLANNAAISTRERRTETATMRVLGYRKRTVVTMLTSESILIGIFGGIIAAAITWLAFRNGVQLTPGGNELRPITVGFPGLVAGALTAVLIPLLGALPSAFAAVRVPLVDALRT